MIFAKSEINLEFCDRILTSLIRLHVDVCEVETYAKKIVKYFSLNRKNEHIWVNILIIVINCFRPAPRITTNWSRQDLGLIIFSD